MPDYKTKHVFIISDSPLFAGGLKRIIDEALVSTKTTICSKESVDEHIIQCAPCVVVFDGLNTNLSGLEHYLNYLDRRIKVIVLGRYDDQIAVYSRRFLLEATVENLIKAITGNGYH